MEPGLHIDAPLLSEGMTPEAAASLRAPFPPETVGKLPKPTNKDNPKKTCPDCGGYHGMPAVHLDYVGHAAVTDRLLQVDPEWTWEPYATTAEGLPLIMGGGLWIRLTICGVTRPGFGDGSSTKEMIGDAIRNAAMRFGVALDLWSKEDLHAFTPEPPVETCGPEQVEHLRRILNSASPADRSAFVERFGHKPAELPAHLYDEAADWLSDLEAALPDEGAPDAG